ncbi:MAG: error-prone DNA polymerase, partial [Myxococcales bacterium]|nr:error-prone DNA polymerase [Myxococcales bacterium]
GVVPIEPASMAGRTVIQWDKDDLDPIGLVKIDLLGLGMLTALSDALRRVRRDRGRPLALHTIPADDGPTYEMIRRADTVGVFQIESRAQMSSLPRNAPDRFYDLVVQVALIRPGPIQGEMVHPYLRRRRGLEPIRTLHPLLEPVLRRTLGVPLFQEQGMRVAVVAAGFSPGQADALRRAMGSKRSRSQMSRLSLQLLAGMQERGIDRAIAERIIKQLGAFASYGFPESHAASFALLVYASAYLKRHYAPEFYAALLDAQPMGFYPVGSLLTDARRHGVEVRPLDVRRSGWGARLEGTRGGAHPFALRLGLGMIRGLGPGAKRGVMRALERGGPRSIEDFARSSGLGQPSLRKLAKAGAFDALAGDRRRALWEVLRLGRVPAGPFDLRAEDPQPPPLCAPSLRDRVAADYESLGGSAERHPIELLRPSLELAGIGTLRALRRREEGPVRVAGLVCSRQRPATAKGFVFLALEDETEMLNVIVHPDLFARRRERIVSSPVLVIDGRLQRSSGTLDLVAEEIEGLDAVPGADAAGSHDFH